MHLTVFKYDFPGGIGCFFQITVERIHPCGVGHIPDGIHGMEISHIIGLHPDIIIRPLILLVKGIVPEASPFDLVTQREHICLVHCRIQHDNLHIYLFEYISGGIQNQRVTVLHDGVRGVDVVIIFHVAPGHARTDIQVLQDGVPFIDPPGYGQFCIVDVNIHNGGSHIHMKIPVILDGGERNPAARGLVRYDTPFRVFCSNPCGSIPVHISMGDICLPHQGMVAGGLGNTGNRIISANCHIACIQVQVHLVDHN